MASLAPLIPLLPEVQWVESDDIGDLGRIYETGVNLCVVRRRITPLLNGFVQRLLATGELFERDVKFGPTHSAAAGLLPDAAQSLPGAEAWLSDVEFLGGLFRDLFGTPLLGMRLRILGKAMCPRFHVDRVPVRMVCTYGGPGSEWLPESALDRTKLGHGACGHSDQVSGLILDPGAVRAVPPFAIALLKGELWEGNEGRGAVHRSPQLTAAARPPCSTGCCGNGRAPRC